MSTTSRCHLQQFAVAVSILAATETASIAAGSDPAEIVEGVSAIVSGGSPGPIHLENDEWWPIVASTSASQPSLFATARVWQDGRVIVFGHDGIMGNPDLDGDLFRLNAILWLADGSPTTVHYTTGHGEWLGGGNLSRLASQLEEIGATLLPLPAPIDGKALADVEVLIVGNAWGEISPEEIDVVHAWVASGGGLLLPGLGWSWSAYHPAQTMEDYPMMRLAEPFGVRWLDGVISDPENNIGGSAILDLFYPKVPSYTIEESLAIIAGAHAEFGSDLPMQLESNVVLRRQFVLAHQIASIPTWSFPSSHPSRLVVRNAFRQLLAAHGETLRRDFAFNVAIAPTATWIRERFWRTLLESVEFTDEDLGELIALGGVGDDQADLFRRYRLLLMDNVTLDALQRSVVRAHLDTIADDLHNLRAISVVDLLGTPAESISLRGRDGGVNIFGLPVGAAVENQFPADAPPGVADLFSVVVAHEITHSVDAFGIGGNPLLRQRRDDLVARAGLDPMNYLRSMLPEGFFISAPQEFVASIANQWFTDTLVTIALGVDRFDGGRSEPLNQVLFMLEVFSNGQPSTPIYSTTLDGTLTTVSAWLERDARGRISTLTLPNVVHHFESDSEGWVVGHGVSPRCLGDINFDGQVNGADIALLLGFWGLNGKPVAADINQDGSVDGADLAQLVGSWGECP